MGDGSADKGTYCQAQRTEFKLTLKTHIVEGSNRVALWPSHGCRGVCTGTHNKGINVIQFLRTVQNLRMSTCWEYQRWCFLQWPAAWEAKMSGRGREKLSISGPPWSGGGNGIMFGGHSRAPWTVCLGPFPRLYSMDKYM